MAKILVCLLGGTIGSRLDRGIVKLGGGASDRSFFEKLKLRSELSYITPVLYSSENATAADYKTALKGIVNAAEEDRPDGILILHGTDSMAYFAQLAVRVLSFLNLPVVITGSKLPPDDSHSDAVKNVSFAASLLEAAIEGRVGSKTFGVVFTDSFMGEATFVPALKVMDADSEGDYRKYIGRKDASVLSENDARAFLSDPDEKKVTVIPDVPGFPYEAIDVSMTDVLLIEAYHSGTQDSVRLPLLIERAKEAGVKCYLAPCPDKKTSYESEKAFEDLIKLKDMPIEGAWAEVVVRG